ncbi:MAG TPA: F0F1 ATP synthase subunit C [Bacillota bacterium]|jgi:F-type H+-transporting ATPase subunit c|nr:F0F1 ATP synthase subunit C [Peptococcaceae bacterium MAG4]NLW37648.1 F0F1 ATP synthase subunit C [Peptococcaceae bacterium]HPU35711.1 F0F1 ATP synthase subunit C [Bacillota bacterium]HPZ42715.1 F0F1 ATP synthase subunit C [Bacillota bacterium]HQD76238.1 F0F1 ATP synthase subunit C [Bacillota bacterium]
MELAAAAALGAALAAGLAALGAALGDAIVGFKAIEGVARQPEARGSVMTLMFISIGLIEALPIIAVVIAFMLFGQVSAH